MKQVLHIGDIDETIVHKMLKSKQNVLVLCSRGGDCDYMKAVLDLMKEGGRTWTVKALGAIMSAAVPIVSSGTPGQRFASPNTRFMVHVPRMWNFSDQTADEAGLEAAELELLERYYCEVLGETTKRPAKWWMKRIKGKVDYYFDAKDAKRFGIIDVIG